MGFGIAIVAERADIENLQRLRCRGILDVPLGQHHARARILEHERDPFGRVGRVEREVDRTRHQHAEKRHDQHFGAIEQDRDDVILPDAASGERARQCVRPVVEICITQGRAQPDNRGRVGVPCDPGCELGRNRRRLGKGDRLDGRHQHVALGGVEQVERRYLCGGIGDGGLYQVRKMPRHPFYPRAIEQVGGIFNVERDAIVVLDEFEAERIFRDSRIAAEGRDRHPVKREDPLAAVLEHDRDVEDRWPTIVRRQVKLLDQPVERIGAVVDRGGDRRAGMPDERGDIVLVVEFEAQWQQIDVEADLAFEVRIVATGDGHTEHQRVAGGVPLEQRCDQRHQSGEYRRVGRARHGTQRVDGGCIDHHRNPVAVIAGHGGREAIERQVEPVGHGVELGVPPIARCGRCRCAEPRGFDGGLFLELETERWQCGAAGELDDLLDHDRHRFSVADDVVNGKEQHVPVWRQR